MAQILYLGTTGKIIGIFTSKLRPDYIWVMLTIFHFGIFYILLPCRLYSKVNPVEICSEFDVMLTWKELTHRETIFHTISP